MEAGPEARPTQPPHSQRITDAEDLDLYGSPDTVNIDDILNVDMTPLSSISTSGPDMSITTSVELGTSLIVAIDDRSREIQDTAAVILESGDTVGTYHFLRNPSLAPNVGPAKLGESSLGTNPPTVQGYTSLGDTTFGMIQSMALGGYTESDDIAQDRFWTSNIRESGDVGSVSDLSMSDFDSRSEYDRYFAEVGARRDSATTPRS